MNSSNSPAIFSSEQAAIQLAAAALPRWTGLSGASIQPVKVRENAVLQVTDDAGTRYALRIHRPGYHSDASLASEFAWMQALRDGGMLLPRVVPSEKGLEFEIINAGGLRYQVDLFEWLESSEPRIALGGLNASLDTLITQYKFMGETMARVHSLSERWRTPARFVRHAWDLEGLVGERPFWGRFWELDLLSTSQQQLMRAVRGRLKHELERLSKGPDQYGLIHADLIPDNVILSNEALYLIDFDDSGFGWHVFDIAVSLFQFSSGPQLDAILDSFVRGYRSRRVLTDASLSQLPMFLAARGTTLLGWLHTRNQAEARTRAPWLIERACAAADRWLDTGA